jgi:hypothetical protein
MGEGYAAGLAVNVEGADVDKSLRLMEVPDGTTQITSFAHDPARPPH